MNCLSVSEKNEKELETKSTYHLVIVSSDFEEEAIAKGL